MVCGSTLGAILMKLLRFPYSSGANVTSGSYCHAPSTQNLNRCVPTGSHSLARKSGAPSSPSAAFWRLSRICEPQLEAISSVRRAQFRQFKSS